MIFQPARQGRLVVPDAAPDPSAAPQPAPSTPGAPPEQGPRERLVAALRQDDAAPAQPNSNPGGKDAQPNSAPTAPALTTLIEALPSDATRAPQTEFVRDLQVLFLENLSFTGSVRSAAAAAGVSHQTAYRARRSGAHFRLAWDGALVAARAAAADTLGCRAIDGIEEQVFYHGEVVATRRRYSDRLLLAHMARLDKLAGDDARANAFAEDWDAAMARFADGQDPLPESPCVPAQAGTSGGSAPRLEASTCPSRSLSRAADLSASRGAEAHDGDDFFSPGQCNTRSMSPGSDADWEEYLAEETEFGNAHGTFEEFLEGKRETRELRERIERERPVGAKLPEELGGDEWVRARQSEAFDVGLDGWWTIVTEDDLNEAYRAAGMLAEPDAPLPDSLPFDAACGDAQDELPQSDRQGPHAASSDGEAHSDSERQSEGGPCLRRGSEEDEPPMEFKSLAAASIPAEPQERHVSTPLRRRLKCFSHEDTKARRGCA